MTLSERLERMGIAVPKLHIPKTGPAGEHWPVIACDQFTSNPGYWEETRRLVGDNPSTLNLIIPECYLDDNAGNGRVKSIHRAMDRVLEDGILHSPGPGFMYVERATPHNPRRQGLVLAVDLDRYNFARDSTAPIRPTEGTIQERLPPRMAARQGASLDVSHILLLMNDADDGVMSAARNAAGKQVYDFNLMQGGGRIQGSFIAQDALEPVVDALERLAAHSHLLFAVGDGNHSLAAAREIWRKNKAAGAASNHPSRYALVEVENIYDPGLQFHPIHRVLFDVDASKLMEQLAEEAGARKADDGSVTVIAPDRSESRWTTPSGRLAVEHIQEVLDAYLRTHPDAGIDYIHGEDAVRNLMAPGRMGILLPSLDKSAFFQRIADEGPYPRKTFSIGEGVEKRYYLEVRTLRS